MLTRSPGSCVLVFWSVNAAHSLTEAKCVCALSKVEGNPLFRHKTYNWHHLHSTYRQTHTTSTPLSRRLICVEVEVLTLSHRCNPSVRLRQDVNKAFKSTPQNDWAVSQAKREFVQQTSSNNVTDVREVCLRFVSPQSGRLTHSGSVPVGPPSVKFSSSRVCCLFLQKSSSQTRLLELWPQEIVW